MLEEKAKFIVISFDNVGHKDKISVDLVPRSWISIKGEKVLCRYPPTRCYSRLEEWVRLEKSPEKEWKNFNVKIIKQSSKSVYLSIQYV